MTCHCCSGPVKRFGHFQNRNRIVQRYRCTRCAKTFSQSQPLDGLRIDHAKAVFIVKLLCEGMGIRACARLASCHIHTVLSVLETTGIKCAALHDRLVQNISVESLQIDELWSKVGVRQARITPGETERGDFYTFLAIDAKTKLILSHYTGKRDNVSTDFFVDDVAKRVAGRVQVTSDGWQAYPDALKRYLLERLDYAVMQKNYATPLGTVDAVRRYSPAPFIGVTIKVKAGTPKRELVCTSFVERANLSVRHFNKRFVRLGIGWSRKLENHRHSVAIFAAAHNFCKEHRSLHIKGSDDADPQARTPAIASGIADHVWTIDELLGAACEPAAY